jgi:hypothetical protein
MAYQRDMANSKVFSPEFYYTVESVSLQEHYEIPISKVNNFKEAVLGDIALAQTAPCTCKA